MITKKIGIIGCGNMGGALLARLSAVVEKSTALMASDHDLKRREEIQTKYRMTPAIDNNYLVKNSEVIVIAVKPQDFESLLSHEVCRGVSKDKLIISIAAGVGTKHIEKVIGPGVPVIRAMPNMPAIIGESMTAICGGSAAGKEHIAIATDIFKTIGDVVEVDEKLMDAVTAVSGSGPAYFFYLVESLIAAAVEHGIDKKNATKLAVKTALGSARLLEALGEDPEELRRKVTSKGGTTEAAFGVFEEKEMTHIIKAAVSKACERSRELSKG
jgi:pyrroline-5-carboxylate reductase